MEFSTYVAELPANCQRNHLSTTSLNIDGTLLYRSIQFYLLWTTREFDLMQRPQDEIFRCFYITTRFTPIYTYDRC